MIRLSVFQLTLFLISSLFTAGQKHKPRLPDEYVFVNGGSVWIGNSDTVRFHQQQDSSQRVSASSFYMSKYELTNQRYREFLADIKNKVTSEEFESLRVDSTGWERSEFVRYGEPLKTHYYRHPAYADFPLVNITYEAANRYCRWLQEKLQAANPDYTLSVTLPTKQEWIFAAVAFHGSAIYPWKGRDLINEKGQYRCNFRKIGDEMITRNKSDGRPEIKSADGYQTASFFTANVKSYEPNDFKLYNMGGNVAEMISEKGKAMGGSWNDFGGDVTVTSETQYTSPAATVGFRPLIRAEKKNQK